MQPVLHLLPNAIAVTLPAFLGLKSSDVKRKCEMHMGLAILHLFLGSLDWLSYFPSAFMPFADATPFAHT